MGEVSVAWVAAYISAFGLSDTLVAMCSAPDNPLLLIYYAALGAAAYYYGAVRGRKDAQAPRS